jgi:Zn-dependent protease
MYLSIIQNITVWVIPVLFAITFHELAHAYVAHRLGDPTAKMLGRLSLNPIKHIDPFGTVLVPLTLGILSNFTMMFGWAKPVPVSHQNFKNQRRALSLVAIAGPMMNLLMALFWAAVLKLSLMLNVEQNALAKFLFFSARAGIIINIILFALNLLPIPPLDGSKVVSNLLPPKWSYHYDKLEPYGFFIIILLLITNLLGQILMPLYQMTLNLLLTLFNL